MEITTTIETERLLLKKPTAKDALSEYKIIKSDDFYKVTHVPKTYTKKMAEEFSKYCAKDFGKGSLTYFMFLKETGEHIGNIGFATLFKRDNAALGAYLISKDHRRKGYTSEGFKAIMNYAFKEMKLNRISIGHIANNKASEGVIKKMGFEFIGIEKKAVLTGEGKYKDHYIYQMLRTQWKPNKIKLKE